MTKRSEQVRGGSAGGCGRLWLELGLGLVVVVLATGCGAGTPATESAAGQKSGKTAAADHDSGAPADRKDSKKHRNTAVSKEGAAEAQAARGASTSAPRAGGKSVPSVRVVRPVDTRPLHDDAKLAALGIRKYASKRLLLYTDIEAEKAAPLPALMDQAYDAWEKYFGPLPPDPLDTDFQMTGYILEDEERFREAGLLPPQLLDFVHGRNLGAQFWMREQESDYYRRHLMLHEGTHCFMTVVPHSLRNNLWYMEGMAELFGTHRLDVAGAAQFRVMPHDRLEFPGHARIRMVQDEVAQGRLQSMDDVRRLEPSEFTRNETYAWSWAMCQFLDNHPRYRERFRRVSQEVRALDSQGDYRRLFEADWSDLCEEWLLFQSNLCYGYDFERSAIDFKSGRPLAPGSTATAVVRADRGWQSAAVQVEQGRIYAVTATGQFTIAQQPKPWVCEPQGVSIRYCEGRPLGQLLACIRSPGGDATQTATTMRDVHAVGRELRWTAPVSGTVYLRVNEFWNELADNAGQITVEIREVALGN